MRSFRTAFAPEQVKAYQAGVLAYRYKGLPCLKSPIDVAIYVALLEATRPKSIIEIGSKAGGSALLFHDLARMVGAEASIVSIDIVPPSVDLPGVARDSVRFLKGDAHDLRPVFAENALDTLPRPWLVIEDSAHLRTTCRAVLDHFADRLRTGEYLVIEDGVLDDLGLTDQYDGGPNRAIAEFFRDRPGVFEIDAGYCDMFGPNATYNPNGYLRRL